MAGDVIKYARRYDDESMRLTTMNFAQIHYSKIYEFPTQNHTLL